MVSLLAFLQQLPEGYMLIYLSVNGSPCSVTNIVETSIPDVGASAFTLTTTSTFPAGLTVAQQMGQPVSASRPVLALLQPYTFDSIGLQ
jgi:hypothetical protein